MKLLKELLVQTNTGDYTAIIEVIVNFLKDSDAKIELQKIEDKKYNVIVIFGKPELVINCHMDTVPAVGVWKYNPYTLKEEGGKMYGLGTCDTKGNIYAVLKAVEKVRPKNLMLLFSVDEETDIKTGVQHFLESEYKKGLKNAIVCEPTGLQFVNKHKGYYSMWIELKSKPKHSQYHDKSNVISQAAEMIVKFNEEGFNIGSIEGGVKGNITPEHCKFKISIRSYDNYEIIMEKVKAIAKKGKIMPSFIGEPLFCPIEDISFSEDEKSVNFWTEAPLFQKEGINSVVFGAGNIEQAHSPDEFVYKDELTYAQKMIEKIIKKL